MCRRPHAQQRCALRLLHSTLKHSAAGQARGRGACKVTYAPLLRGGGGNPASRALLRSPCAQPVQQRPLPHSSTCVHVRFKPLRNTQDMAALQYESDLLASRAQAEKVELLVELNRLHKLVASFQAQIMSVFDGQQG